MSSQAHSRKKQNRNKKTVSCYTSGGKLRGSPSEYYHYVWYTEKLEWRGYPMVKNVWMFTPSDRMHECDRQMDRRTDTAWRHKPRLCTALCEKTAVYRYHGVGMRNNRQALLRPSLSTAFNPRSRPSNPDHDLHPVVGRPQWRARTCLIVDRCRPCRLVVTWHGRHIAWRHVRFLQSRRQPETR